MYRDDLEAARARADAAKQELAEARRAGRADQNRIARLEAALAYQRAEIERLQELAPSTPSELEQLVARGNNTMTRQERADARAAKRRQPSRRREELTTTPFGCFATTDALPSYAMILFAASVGAAFLWASSPALLPLAIAMPLLVVPVLYTTAAVTRVFTHRAVVKWAADLPFEINYPYYLASEDIESAWFIIEFRDAPPHISALSAAVRGLGKWWLTDGESADAGQMRVRFSMAGTESDGRYTAHRRMRWITDRLIVPLHEHYPIRSVRLEGF